MPNALLVRGGDLLFLLERGRPPETLGPLGDSAEAAAEWVESGFRRGLPASMVRLLRERAGGTIVATEPLLVEALRAADVPARLCPEREARAAREQLPEQPTSALRPFVFALARRELEHGLASPEEVVQALAREDERVERAVGRELAAAEQFLLGPTPAARRYTESSEQLRGAYGRHFALLREELSVATRAVAPNLVALLGGPLAARLILGAGGLASLGRMSGARIQLLGARRRPSPERGPRFGYLYRAPRMDEVPLDRQGAYARSLAALAAIASRADAFTHSTIGPWLLARRDRRVADLRRRR